ncbi:hemagglutinin repeat-containing protein [Providencia rettgeri]
MSKTTKSGLMSTGGIGFTVGSNSQKVTTETDSNQKKGSVIGSTAGDVTLTAGGTANIHGSDVIAAKDINVTGSDANITAAENSRTDITTVESKSSGLTVSLGGTAGSLLDGMAQTAKSAKQEDDGQLAALKGMKAGLQGVQAQQAGELAGLKEGGSVADAFGVNVSYGSSSSKSTTKTEQHTASGSSLSAGDNINLTATGKKDGSQGNLTVQGSQLDADKNVTLTAKNDINLTSAINTQKVDGKNESKGSSIGAGISTGGWNVNASVNKGSGFEKGDSQFYTDTEVNAGKQLTLNSGKDTTLTGAHASGETVKANVGGDLTLSSQQVTDKYDSKQQGGSLSGSIGTGLNTTASVNVNKTEMHSDYQSVDKQTGINAGKGGFDITVGNHTQLDGAVISSTAEAEKNKLDTGTLGFGDIKNKAEYKVDSQSGGFSTGGSPFADQLAGNAAGSLLTNVNNKGKDSNTTHSAVSEGEITIRNKDNQKQDINELSRDTDNAHEKLNTIFDKEKEQKRIEKTQLVGELGKQITDIAVTNETIKATKDVDREHPELSGKEREDAIQAQVNKSEWGVGGDNRRIVESGTALIQGLISGDVNKAVANASAPYIANEIAKNIPEKNKEGRIIAHGIANVALALAKGENAGAQSLGAMRAEAVGMLSKELYKKDVSQLTEDEKATVSAFASLAAGIAGGLVGGDTSSAGNAAQAGKTTVENNLFGGTEDGQLKFARDHAKDVMSCADNPSGEACIRGQAVDDALKLALATGLGTHGLIIAVDAAAAGCLTNPALCATEATNFIIEMLGAEAAPAGIAITGTAGYTAKLTKEQLVELATLQAVRKEGGDVTPEMVNKVISGNTSKEIPKITNEQKVIEIKSGSKGDWNKQLNKPEPNTIYQVDGNKTYKTDSQGRVETVEAKLSLNSNDRNTYQQCKVGKCGVAGDEGGHLIATIFTGPGEKLNIVPMNSNLNRSEWKKMENSWAKALKDNKEVDVRIEPIYSGNSERPVKFNVRYTIEGERPVIKNFTNAQGGN